MRIWKYLFLILETWVLVAVLFPILAKKIWGVVIEPQPGAFVDCIVVFSMAAWLFLLVVSPFFLRSLRGVALAGWIIAMGIFIFAALQLD
jgi:hypothetical protein